MIECKGINDLVIRFEKQHKKQNKNKNKNKNKETIKTT